MAQGTKAKAPKADAKAAAPKAEGKARTPRGQATVEKTASAAELAALLADYLKVPNTPYIVLVDDQGLMTWRWRGPIDSAIIDPKNFASTSFVDRTGDTCIIPPNSFALGHTIEYFRIPRDVLVVCLGKSTYARCGIIVNVTPFEPEWEGHVTLEFSNTTPLPARIYANEGVAQMLFLESDEVCETSYKDRGGKYQGQRGVTLPRT